MFTIDTKLKFNERYDFGKFLKYGDKEESFDIFNSQFLYEFSLLQPAGEYTVTIEENAPDLVSWNLWGSEQMFWLLMYYNGISCYQELTPGIKLKFPSYADIEKIYFKLR